MSRSNSGFLETVEKWHVSTPEGEQFGPVSYAELEEWVRNGQVDASCFVISDGWNDWKSAGDQFPELVEPAAGSPFEFGASQPHAGSPQFAVSPASGSRPTGGSVGRRRKKEKWVWSFNFMFGVMYGPVPVGWIVLGIVLLFAGFIKVLTTLVG